jgi:anti-anti-sigma factor
MQRLQLTESEIRQNGHGGREIRVEGEVDLAVASQLHDAIERAPSAFVLVDLGECEFIDTAAVAAVLAARRDGHRVLLHSPAGQVRRVLEVTGLTEDGLVYPDRDEALGSLD